ncbi:MAG: SDR family oxidoreductase [Chloroflexota bacterium]
MTNQHTFKEKIVLITGATNGIGKEAARQIAKTGATVVVAGRNHQKLEQTVDEVKASSSNLKIEGLLADLSTLAGMQSLASQFLDRYDRLDVLLNNAGALFTERQVTPDGFEKTFALNHLSYFVVTNLLLDALSHGQPARIINVASDVHLAGHMNFDDLHGESSYTPLGAYRQSKLGNVMFTYELAERLEGTQITVNALHPGVVQSGFGKNNKGVVGRVTSLVLGTLQRFQGVNVAAGADTPIYLSISPEVEGITGKYWYKRQPKASSAESRDAEQYKRLWAESLSMTQLMEVAS